MKIFLLSIIIIISISSCKKTEPNTCEITMAQIAGSYKLTKVETVSYSTGLAQDVTAAVPACELSGIYHFNTDSSATYTEATDCNGSGIGTWSISGKLLLAVFSTGDGGRISSTTITSWDCTNLVLITNYPSAVSNDRFTLTKF